MSVSIETYFDVRCNICNSVLYAFYNERIGVLEVSPCESCIEQAISADCVTKAIHKNRQ